MGTQARINCAFDTGTHVGPSASIADQYNFWQYGNTDLSGLTPAVFDNVVTLTTNDTRFLAAQDANTWLYGWSPQLLPNILTNPASQTVTAGEQVSLTVSATGIPAPTYQWKHGGTNLVGETNATLSIASAQATDGGDYVVEVSNVAGTVTSSTATLTVADPPNIDISIDEGVLSLSWPSNHTGWLLQYRTNLLDGSWQDLPGSETNHVYETLINGLSPDSAYYKLVNP